MVKRVEAPAEHFLITNGSKLVAQFGMRTLQKFATAKLLEHKLTSRNFKAGLDFGDSHKANLARTKLATSYITYMTNDLPHIFAQDVVETPFIGKEFYSNSDRIRVTVMYDKSVLKYVRRVQNYLYANGIPVAISVYSHNAHEHLDSIIIDIIPDAPSTEQLRYYKLLCIIPQTINFFRCLSRKARFTDKNVRSISRSKHSGLLSAASLQRNRSAPRSTAVPITST